MKRKDFFKMLAGIFVIPFLSQSQRKACSGILMGENKEKKYGYIIVAADKCICDQLDFRDGPIHSLLCPAQHIWFNPYDCYIYNSKDEAERIVVSLNKSRINKLVAKKIEILGPVDLGSEFGINKVVRIVK